MKGPLVLTRNDWYPPQGISALPEDIQKLVPEEFCYWKEASDAKREEMLDTLRNAWNGETFLLKRSFPNLQKQQHSRTQCMNCKKAPEYEVLWAEGMAHAWFCKNHFEQWAKESASNCIKDGFPASCEIDAVKMIDNGEASKKWSDNTNKDIWDDIRDSIINKSSNGKGLLRVTKSNYEKQWVFGVVLSPHEIDSWGDYETPEEIADAVAAYMLNLWKGQKPESVGKQHEEPINAIPIQCFQAPVDFWYDDSPHTPEYMVPKGAWVLGIHILDKKEFEKVVSGEYIGFSMQGTGVRRKVE